MIKTLLVAGSLVLSGCASHAEFEQEASSETTYSVHAEGLQGDWHFLSGGPNVARGGSASKNIVCFPKYEPIGGGSEQYHAERLNCGYTRGSDSVNTLAYILPGVTGIEIKDTAISNPYGDDATIFALGSDNRVRRVHGDPTALSAPDQFRDWVVHAEARYNTGESICLREISEYRPPSRYAPSSRLMGVTCNDEIVQLGFQNGARVWYPATNYLPWSMLPPGNWRSLSDGWSRGTFALSTSGYVWLVGRGTMAANGSISYDAPTLAPTDGVPIDSVGFPYILVAAGGDALVIRYDVNTEHYGVAQFGRPVDYLAGVSSIIRATPAFGTETFAVWQGNYRAYSWSF